MVLVNMKIKIVLTLFILSMLFSCNLREQKYSQHIDTVINKLEVAAKNGKEHSNLNDSRSVACKAFITYVKIALNKIQLLVGYTL